MRSGYSPRVSGHGIHCAACRRLPVSLSRVARVARECEVPDLVQMSVFPSLCHEHEGQDVIDCFPARAHVGARTGPARFASWSAAASLLLHSLPRIWESLRIDTAVMLPVGVEAYAAYALRAWPAHSRQVSSGDGGPGCRPLLTQADASRARWEITAAVSGRTRPSGRSPPILTTPPPRPERPAPAAARTAPPGGPARQPGSGPPGRAPLRRHTGGRPGATCQHPPPPRAVTALIATHPRSARRLCSPLASPGWAAARKVAGSRGTR